MKKIILLASLFLCATITHAQSSDPLADMFLNDNANITIPSTNMNAEVAPILPVAPVAEPSIVQPESITTVTPPTQDPPASSIPNNNTPPTIGTSNVDSLHAAAPTNTNTNESLSNSNTNGEGGALPQTGGTAIPFLIVATMLSLLATKSLAWFFNK